MAHHGAHPRTITLTVPHIPWRKVIRSIRAGARQFEGMAARHWPFAAYGALTLAVAAYVVYQLVSIP